MPLDAMDVKMKSPALVDKKRAGSAGSRALWLAISFTALIVLTYRFIRSSTSLWLEHLAPGIISHHGREPLSDARARWTWGKLHPKKDLEWHTCYEDFQCARLDLPLDWLDPSENARVSIAVIRLPATDREDYKGAVFFNPGGPGGSGVFAMRDRGKFIQKIIGRNYDLVSFDPRGIGASTPTISCWSSEQTAKMWSIMNIGVADAHPGLLYDAYAKAFAYSKACASTMSGGADGPPHSKNMSESGIMSFVSTTSVARDMLEIMGKIGEVKLRYWGFSYGTMLGGIFASLWPEKVERMVNDGNVHYAEWVTNTHHSFLHDTDKVMDAFYYYCHISGPLKCAFYAASPSAIEARLDALLSKLRKQPIIMPTSLQILGLPELISYSSVQKLISTTLYQPVFAFPRLAKILAAIENGDGGPFIELFSAFIEPFSCSSPAVGDPDIDPEVSEGNEDAFSAVLCSDGGEMDDSIPAFEGYAKDIMKQSKAAGGVSVISRMSCVGWRVRAKWRFAGPFIGETSHPILFIANQADNITPLVSAVSNANGFTNSSVLISNSFGHTSLSTPSTCIASHIRAYFQHGTVPRNGTSCEPDITPFQTPGEDEMMRNLDQNEKALSEATWKLAERAGYAHLRGFK